GKILLFLYLDNFLQINKVYGKIIVIIIILLVVLFTTSGFFRRLCIFIILFKVIVIRIIVTVFIGLFFILVIVFEVLIVVVIILKLFVFGLVILLEVFVTVLLKFIELLFRHLNLRKIFRALSPLASALRSSRSVGTFFLCQFIQFIIHIIQFQISAVKLHCQNNNQEKQNKECKSGSDHHYIHMILYKRRNSSENTAVGICT